jgi:DHA1 family bicyclomycin/chloramphenicol resistance-like MFS transporter
MTIAAGAPAKPLEPPWFLAPLLTALILIPVFSVDIQLPAMPAIAKDLATTPGLVQASLLAFIAAFGICHLLYGPFADRFGRRPFLIGGMALYTVAGLAATLAPSIDLLIAARIPQGIGAAAGPLLARAVIRDVYGARGAGRMLGYIMAVFGLGAVALPFVGTGLMELAGWRGAYFASVILGICLTTAVIVLLPETAPAEAPGSVRFLRRVQNYFVILKDTRFLAFICAGGFVQVAMFAWISGGSFVLIDVLGQSRLDYNVAYGITVTAFIFMSTLSGRLASRIGTARLTLIGTWFAAAGGAAGLALALFGTITTPALILVISIVILGHGFTLPQSMAGSIAPFPTMAATASALFGCLQYLLNASAVALNGIFYDNTAVPMLVIIAGSTACAAAGFTFAYARMGARLKETTES